MTITTIHATEQGIQIHIWDFGYFTQNSTHPTSFCNGNQCSQLKMFYNIYQCSQQTDMCKFQSSQKDENGAKQADSLQACHEIQVLFLIFMFSCYCRSGYDYQHNTNQKDC